MRVRLNVRLAAASEIKDSMKKCSYCGTEYSDDTVECMVDHTPLEKLSEPVPPIQPKQTAQEYVPRSEISRLLKNSQNL
jgi:hypothetical protein